MELETEFGMLFMIADATNKDAGAVSTFIDAAVQTFGQPNPAMTHCEPWMLEQKPTDDNHFGQYLGQKSNDKLTGALYTSDLPASRAFYQQKWAAVPVFAVDSAQKMRTECDQHVGTPYPSIWRLFDYPWSVWPLRSLAWMVKSDQVGQPAHCAALSARILRRAIPKNLWHSSFWYGPASLYLELSRPSEMKRALELQRPAAVVRSHVDVEAETKLLAILIEGSDEDVAAMSAIDSKRAVTVAAINVLIAGAEDTVDQTDFLDVQKKYATAMVRHTWVGRPAREKREQAELEEKRENAERALEREAEPPLYDRIDNDAEDVREALQKFTRWE